MNAIRRAGSLARTEQELRAEKAAALGRAGERLEQALADVAALARQYQQSTEPAERCRLAQAYEAARRQATAARTALLIQREACGIRHHAVVDQVFPEPLPLLGTRALEFQGGAGIQGPGERSWGAGHAGSAG